MLCKYKENQKENYLEIIYGNGIVVNSHITLGVRKKDIFPIKFNVMKPSQEEGNRSRNVLILTNKVEGQISVLIYSHSATWVLNNKQKSDQYIKKGGELHKDEKNLVNKSATL